MNNFIKKNAVLYKEMIVDMKTPKAMIITIIMNALLSLIAVCFLIGIAAAGSSLEGYIWYRVIPWMLTAIYYVEAGLIIFLVPAITAGTISLEKERQTLDVLLTTRMTPWEIIIGKYFSNVVFVFLLIMSSLPIWSLAFIYGGFPLWKILVMLLVLMTITCYFSSFGIFFSSVTKNTILSVILTYIFSGAIFSVTTVLAISGISIVEVINAFIAEKFRFITNDHLINGDGFIFFLLLNPIVTVFDVIGTTIGYSFGSEGQYKGVAQVAGYILPHFTEKNILLNLWTPISMFFQLLISVGLLRIAAAALNPLKKPKRYKNKDFGMK